MTDDVQATDVVRIEQALYEHREGGLTCYDHPGSSLIRVWCCPCGEHNLTETWRHHVARHLADYTPGVPAAGEQP